MRPLILLIFSSLPLLAMSGCQRQYAAPRHPVPTYAAALPPEAPSPYTVTAPPVPSSPPPAVAQSPGPPANPVPNGAAAKPAATRLLQLKELLDRKLITPEEYEERRRVIIDAL